MINQGQFMEDLEYQLRILFASPVLKKTFNTFWKHHLLAPFEGKHSENLHALSTGKAQTQPGRIYRISMTNIWYLSTSVLSVDMENGLLVSAMASGISISRFPEISLWPQNPKIFAAQFFWHQCAVEKSNAIMGAWVLSLPDRWFREFLSCSEISKGFSLG